MNVCKYVCMHVCMYVCTYVCLLAATKKIPVYLCLYSHSHDQLPASGQPTHNARTRAAEVTAMMQATRARADSHQQQSRCHKIEAVGKTWWKSTQRFGLPYCYWANGRLSWLWAKVKFCARIWTYALIEKIIQQGQQGIQTESHTGAILLYHTRRTCANPLWKYHLCPQVQSSSVISSSANCTNLTASA